MPRGSDDPLAFPPPPAGSVPPPKALQGAAGFKPSISTAFAHPEPEVKPTVQQQTIKIDDAEIHEERKKAGKKSMVFVLLAAIVALVLGFPLGMFFESTRDARAAQKGASDLAKDIKTVTDEIKNLSDELRKGVEQLDNDQFPTDLVTYLQKTNLDFTAEKFKGRGVGGLPQDTLRPLLAFTQSMDDLNKRKTGLFNLLSAKNNQDLIAKYWALRKEPVINFSVLLDKRGDDYFALLVQNKTPFPQKGAPPAKYTVSKKPASGEKEGKDVEADRLKDDSKLDGTKLVPLDESTAPSTEPPAKFNAARGAINVTRILLEGEKNPTDPDGDKPGLIKDGEKLADQLAKIGAAK